MKINSIQSFNNQLQPNKQTNFKQLRLKGDAIVKLDQAFCENPGLTEKFIEKIFLPLKKCKVDVVFDGYSTYFREPKDNFYK